MFQVKIIYKIQDIDIKIIKFYFINNINKFINYITLLLLIFYYIIIIIIIINIIITIIIKIIKFNRK